MYVYVHMYVCMYIQNSRQICCRVPHFMSHCSIHAARKSENARIRVITVRAAPPCFQARQKNFTDVRQLDGRKFSWETTSECAAVFHFPTRGARHATARRRLAIILYIVTKLKIREKSCREFACYLRVSQHAHFGTR